MSSEPQPVPIFPEEAPRPSPAAAFSLPGPRRALTIEPCRSTELGPEWQSDGVRFGVYSRHARKIHLALFRDALSDPVDVLPLPSRHGHVFQGLVPGLEPGWSYGFFADGPFDPRNGHRFNPQKFLLDPYARALTGSFRNPDGVLCGHPPGGEDADLALDHRPSHAYMPKCLLVESRFDWQGVPAPRHPSSQLVIYETHVRGFTQHPSSGVAERGTYRGLVEKIPHLRALGVNAVELLPVHAKATEGFLSAKGLVNYWGYNTAAFFAPEPGYGSRSAPGCEIDEFKLMVRELHRAGIEVILDVVFNHSAESAESGPTLSLRGLDNRSYYALTGPDDAPRRFYWNHTGCGNTLDFGSEAVLRLTLDALRYWVEEYHIDGFRFDEATVHGRVDGSGYRASAPFFAAVAQDPVLRRIRRIAEPWDAEAYALGGFPDGWMEWNGSFRDTVRRFVRGEAGLLPALRARLNGSPAWFAAAGRAACESVNYVTSHDGFTLRDLVTYNHKHNQANGEDNWDGSAENFSWNSGEEGETARAEVEELRGRQAKNLLLLVALARGTPMLLGGDEFLRTQSGNNNAYCQDNRVSWLDWSLEKRQTGFLRFVRLLMPWREIVWSGAATGAGDFETEHWEAWNAAGFPAEEKDLAVKHGGFFLRPGKSKPSGSGFLELHQEGGFYLLLNAEEETRTFHLPHLAPPWQWRMVIDTSFPSPEDAAEIGAGFPLYLENRYEAADHSAVLVRAIKSNSEGN